MIESDFVYSVLDRGLADFMARCDRNHPDLQKPPIRGFLEEVDQMVSAGRFCLERGLAVPLELIRRSSPKSLCASSPMVRTLKQNYREESRSAKVPFYFDSSALLKQAERWGADIPSSFDLFSSDKDCVSAIRDDWMLMSSRFSSIGCLSLASAAKFIGEKGSIGDVGYSTLSISMAATILFKRAKGKKALDSKIVACNFKSRPMPQWTHCFVEDSERAMEGFPVFDHHILVCLENDKEDRGLEPCDFVVLGERDGECHFVCSN
jgi:hypothetical protein